MLPLEPSSCPTWHASFRHLASYGAGYYTYLWARALSRRIWRHSFEDEPLNAAAGSRWMQTVLRHGGAVDPRELLRSLLRQDEAVDGAAGSEPCGSRAAFAGTSEGSRAAAEREAEAAVLELVEL